MDTFLPNERGKNRLEGTCTLLLRESLSLSLSALPFSARAGLKYASPLSSMLQFNFATSLRRGGGEEGRGGEGSSVRLRKREGQGYTPCGQGVTNECTCQHCKPPSFNLLRAGVHQALYPPVFQHQRGKLAVLTRREGVLFAGLYYYVLSLTIRSKAGCKRVLSQV